MHKKNHMPEIVQLENSVAEKDLEVLVATRLNMSQHALQQRRETAFWLQFSTASTLRQTILLFIQHS